MNQDELFLMGKIVRTFGSKGEVVFQCNNEILSQIKKLESVFLKLNENLVPFFIEHLQRRPKGQALVKFLDVDQTEEASLLCGCEIFIPPESVPQPKGRAFFSKNILGYSVIDKLHGETGIVRDVIEMPQQSLLSIDCNGKEILVPVVDEFVRKIDHKNRILHIETPEGLIDLYIN